VRKLFAAPAALAMATAIALGTSACGSDSESQAAAGTGTTGTASPADYQVALLHPGTCNDGSWSQATCEGLDAAVDEHGVEISGNAEELLTPDQYTQQGNAFAREGADLVLMANGSVPQSLAAVARANPEATVCIAAATIPPADIPANACTYDPEQQEGAFVAGYLAALTSKTGKLGVIGAFAFPALTRQMEGFTLGARYARPDIQVQQVYINSWTDVNAAKAAAQAQFADDVDIVFSATDSATQGIFAAAQQQGDGHYVIASYFDSHEQAPGVVLTSVLYNLQGVTEEMVRRGVEGEIRPRNYVFGLDFGVGELAPFYELEDEVPAEAKERVAQLVEDIKAGRVTVPSTAVLGRKGAGSTIDPATLTRQPAS
jgi:basic membrane protein A and related proteins